jgi:WD40 repeat protein
MEYTEQGIVTIPESVLASVIAPFLSDRTTFNNVCLVNKEVRRLVMQACHPPWPSPIELATHAEVHSVAVSEDGRLLACACQDSLIWLWNVETGRPIRLEGHEQSVQQVTFSPNGNYLASASYDYAVRVWDLSDYSCTIFRGHTWGVWSVAFAPNYSSTTTINSDDEDSFLISAGSDQTIRLWRLSSNGGGIISESSVIHTADEVIMSISISPLDGKTIAFGCQAETVRLLRSDDEIIALEGHSDFVNQVIFSPNGKLLASASDDCSVRVWHLAKDYSCSERTIVLRGHKDAVTSVAFSPCGVFLASGSDHDTIRMWQHETGSCTATIGRAAAIYTLSFSPNGRTLFCGDDEHMRIWGHETWKRRRNSINF